MMIRHIGSELAFARRGSPGRACAGKGWFRRCRSRIESETAPV